MAVVHCVVSLVVRSSDLVAMLPHLAAVVVERVERAVAGLRLWVRPRGRRACCPRCGRGAARVHSRYERRLADVALAGEPVEIRLRVLPSTENEDVQVIAGEDAGSLAVLTVTASSSS